MCFNIRKTGRLLLLIILVMPSVALGATAKEAVEREVGRVLETLKSDVSNAQKRAAIRKQVIGFFDFELMSKLALSYHWKQMSADERKQFVPLYRKLLENAYMDKLLGYDDQSVRFGRSTKLSESRVQVRTQVVSDGQSVPLHYKLIRRDGKWQVYDLVIENVSMAKNYRSQFNSFLQHKSAGQLLEELRRKTQARQTD